MSDIDDAVLHDLSIANEGAASGIAKLALDGRSLSEKQIAVLERAIANASTCIICGEYAGFDGDEYCEKHSE